MGIKEDVLSRLRLQVDDQLDKLIFAMETKDDTAEAEATQELEVLRKSIDALESSSRAASRQKQPV